MEATRKHQRIEHYERLFDQYQHLEIALREIRHNEKKIQLSRYLERTNKSLHNVLKCLYRYLYIRICGIANIKPDPAFKNESLDEIHKRIFNDKFYHLLWKKILFSGKSLEYSRKFGDLYDEVEKFIFDLQTNGPYFYHMIRPFLTYTPYLSFEPLQSFYRVHVAASRYSSDIANEIIHDEDKNQFFIILGRASDMKKYISEPLPLIYLESEDCFHVRYWTCLAHEVSHLFTSDLLFILEPMVRYYIKNKNLRGFKNSCEANEVKFFTTYGEDILTKIKVIPLERQEEIIKEYISLLNRLVKSNPNWCREMTSLIEEFKKTRDEIFSQLNQKYSENCEYLQNLFSYFENIYTGDPLNYFKVDIEDILYDDTAILNQEILGKLLAFFTRFHLWTTNCLLKIGESIEEYICDILSTCVLGPSNLFAYDSIGMCSNTRTLAVINTLERMGYSKESIQEQESAEEESIHEVEKICDYIAKRKRRILYGDIDLRGYYGSFKKEFDVYYEIIRSFMNPNQFTLKKWIECSWDKVEEKIATMNLSDTDMGEILKPTIVSNSIWLRHFKENENTNFSDLKKKEILRKKPTLNLILLYSRGG